MRDDFVGNIGDYGKYGLLRALCGLHPRGASDHLSLGVVWYQTPPQRPESGNFDYLDQKKYERCDPDLFKALKEMRDSARQGDSGQQRSLSAIEDSEILGEDTVFFDKAVPGDIPSRKEWFAEALEAVKKQDVIFLDPDEGLRVKESEGLSEKHACIGELEEIIVAGKIAVVYHHHDAFRMQYRIRNLTEHLRSAMNLKLLPETLYFEPARNDFLIVFPDHAVGSIDNMKLILKRVRRLMKTPDSKWANGGYFVARLGDQTAREAIEFGLTVLRDGLRDYCKSIEDDLTSRYRDKTNSYRDDWKTHMIDGLNKKYSTNYRSQDCENDDPVFLLDALRWFGEDGIRKKESPSLTNFRMIRDRRNEWAHFDEISEENVSRALGVMASVLGDAEEVHRQVWIDHQRRLFEQMR